MFTIQYKGYFIHGYLLSSNCTINTELNAINHMSRPVAVKSLHAAKCVISRWIKLNVLHL